MAQGAPLPWWYNLMMNYDMGSYGGFNGGAGMPGMGYTTGTIEGQQTTPIYSVTGTDVMPNDAWNWNWAPPVGSQGQGQAMGAQPYTGGGNAPTPPKAEAAMPLPVDNLIPEDQIMSPWAAPPEEDPNWQDPAAPVKLPPWWTDVSQIPPGGQPPFGVPLGAILIGAGAGAGAGVAAGMGGGNGPTAPPAQAPGVTQDWSPPPEPAQSPYVDPTAPAAPPFGAPGPGVSQDWSPPNVPTIPVDMAPVLNPPFETSNIPYDPGQFGPAGPTLGPVFSGGGGTPTVEAIPAGGGGGTTSTTTTPKAPTPGLVGAALSGGGAPGPGLFAPIVGDPNGKVSVFQPMPMQQQAQSLGEILSQYLGGQYGQR